MMTELLKYYLILQGRRFQRKCDDLGLSPFLVVIISLVFFIAGSSYLYFRTEYASPAFLGIAVLSTTYLINGHHLETLSTIFSNKVVVKIRLVEHMLIAIPFSAFLAYKQEWWWIPALFSLLGVLSIIPLKSKAGFRIPTPFHKNPFEFIVGFRSSILLILLAYFLIFKGIQVGNSNLSFASLGFLFLLGVAFQMKIEDTYFVWIHKLTPAGFIRYKIKKSFLQSIMLSLPGTVTLLFFFSSNYLALVFIHIGGLILLVTLILAKFAAYPKELNLPQVILIGISIIFPPMLFYTIPAFYKKAKQQLRPYLLC